MRSYYLAVPQFQGLYGCASNGQRDDGESCSPEVGLVDGMRQDFDVPDLPSPTSGTLMTLPRGKELGWLKVEAS